MIYVNFKYFLLTTTEDTENIKSENFEFNWKDFFVNNDKLQSIRKNYYFENLVIESDFKEWCKKVIWFGRRSNQFRCHPENLKEKSSELKISQMAH